jgi:serine/threonine protein phosphatase PrpC
MTGFTGSAATDPGGRADNEDAFLNRSDLGLWAVADGAGGYAHGAAASRAVIEALDAIPSGLSGAEMLAQVRLRLTAAHVGLLAKAAAQGNGCVMASTVVVLIARGSHFVCLWAGDSRVYRLRDGALHQLTRDHSLVQRLLDDGEITEAEADTHPQRNVITRAIGGSEDLETMDKVTGRLHAADRFLLCSDGLCKTLSSAELAECLVENAEAEPMVMAALRQGASDNVTAVVVDVI